MLDLEKAQRLSLTMQVEVRLKNALIVGSLRPGARLVTKEIARSTGDQHHAGTRSAAATGLLRRAQRDPGAGVSGAGNQRGALRRSDVDP